MELGELITLYRKQAGLTIDELSERANVPKGTLNKIIGGITKAPTLETMRSIAYALGKKLADFDDEPNISMLYSPAEGQLIKKYRTLDRHGKNAVDCILDIEIDRIVSAQRAEKEKAERKSALQNHQEDTSEEIAIYITTLYHQPVSAGNGESSEYDYSETVQLKKMPPNGTSYIGARSRGQHGAFVQRRRQSFCTRPDRHRTRADRRVFYGWSNVDQGAWRRCAAVSQSQISAAPDDGRHPLSGACARRV